MIKRIIPAVILTLSLTGACCAAEKPTTEERLVGGTFKALAKAYVATANIEDLKAKNIRRIEVMKPERFQTKYAEVYAVAKALPPKIKAKYGFTEQMTKAEAVRIVRTLDRPKLYEIIDNVPDAVIAEKFFERQGQGGPSDEGKNLMESIGKAWEKLERKVNKAPPAHPHPGGEGGR